MQQNSFKMIPSCPTPSHTPDCRSWSRLSGLMRSRLDTPLGSYIKKRQSNENVDIAVNTPGTRQNMVPLSRLSSTVAEDNSVGGCFNATTKMVPLPSLHIPHLTASAAARKGIKSVRLHSQRYNPTQNCTNRTTLSYSDHSLANMRKLKNQQAENFARRFVQVDQARERKTANRIIPHRADGIFYMNGHSANINRRSMFSTDEMDILQQTDGLSENTDLYYGRGVRISNEHRPTSKAIAKLHNRLKQQAENDDEFIGDFDNSPQHQQSHSPPGSNREGLPIVVSFSVPPSAPLNKRQSLMSTIYGKKTVFITEDSKDLIDDDIIS